MKHKVPYGLVVRILAFHAGGPGSIPGVGRIVFVFLNLAFNTSLILKLLFNAHFLQLVYLGTKKTKTQANSH